jgi:glycosyltransferase involved in cell wall biosynthesis
VNAEVCASAEEMHAKLAALITDEPRRAEMSRVARQFAESRSWDSAIGELMEAYREAAH